MLLQSPLSLDKILHILKKLLILTLSMMGNNSMANNDLYIVCKNCGHYEKVNHKLFAKILGGCIAGFGYWAWVSYLFAGTGLAMPICIAIMAGGVAMVAFAEQIVGWINKTYPCPKCGKKVWTIAKYNEIQQDKK